MKMLVLTIAALSLGAPAIAQDPAAPAGGSAMPAMPQAAPSDPAAPSAPAAPAAPDAVGSNPIPAPPAAAAGPADTSAYPVCSKTVTDKCINRSAAPHKAARKR